MKNTAWIVLSILSLVTPSVVAAADNDSTLYVGVLEDIDTHGEGMLSSKPHVRVAFVKKNDDWLPMNTKFPDQAALESINRDYPQEVHWTIVFDGKNVGAVAGRNPGALQWYGDVGVEVITSKIQDIPAIKTGSKNFGFTAYEARNRPLLAVSAPNSADPDRWKPTTLSNAKVT